MDHLLSAIEAREIAPGFMAKFVHSEFMTTSFVEVEEGAELPLHSHMNEQISIITKGEFEMTIDGVTNIYEPGMVIEIPANVPHEGRALTACKITDVFCPVREDFKS
jgi:quercetin dioxygenase-like cupin family protein